MTEPLEPRNPEEGGGAPDPFDDDDVAFTDAEIDAWAADRTIATGYNNLDRLFDWGQEVRDAPLPPKTAPERIQEVHDLNTQFEGNPMSATEDAAAQIRALADSQNVPTAVLSEAYTRLGDFLREIQAATGENSQHREALMGSAQQAQGSIETAIAACTQLLDDIHRAADGHARG